MPSFRLEGNIAGLVPDLGKVNLANKYTLESDGGAF
jgi:hypothetical protein